jgi:uncharacterized protein (TIGR01244 family)
MDHPLPTLNALDSAVSVTGQLFEEHLQWIAAQGFRSVINNRPDLEGGPSQPLHDQIAKAAEQAGLKCAYLPVVPLAYKPQDIAQLQELLKTLPKPILMFCRSGARSTQMYHTARSSA